MKVVRMPAGYGLDTSREEEILKREGEVDVIIRERPLCPGKKQLKRKDWWKKNWGTYIFEIQKREIAEKVRRICPELEYLNADIKPLTRFQHIQACFRELRYSLERHITRRKRVSIPYTLDPFFARSPYIFRMTATMDELEKIEKLIKPL